ncbi:hypothetical protein QBC37DRAFT_481824 [Rhypophila decipiens]|uniref:Uncharacterized protein n=1 Tax=Rhypophila decipiens TaxID=261697 RepID=A0AAN6YA63_9PEZI|nr:hypothetical protein QBC37DRAFT_481824 [Rhypophila decipiens]
MRFSIIIVALSAASPVVHATSDGVGGSNSCQADGQLIQLLSRHVDEAASFCGIPRRKVITKTVTTTTTTTKVVRKVIHTTTTVDAGRKLKAREVQAETTGTVEVLRPRVDLDGPVEMALSDALGDFAAAAVLSACECLNQVEVITTTTTVLKTSVVKTTTTTTSITVETNGAFRIFATEDGDRRKRSPMTKFYLQQVSGYQQTQFHESVEDAIQFRLIHGVDDPKVLWFASESLGNLYGIYWSEFEYGDFFPQAVTMVHTGRQLEIPQSSSKIPLLLSSFYSPHFTSLPPKGGVLVVAAAEVEMKAQPYEVLPIPMPKPTQAVQQEAMEVPTGGRDRNLAPNDNIDPPRSLPAILPLKTDGTVDDATTSYQAYKTGYN